MPMRSARFPWQPAKPPEGKQNHPRLQMWNWKRLAPINFGINVNVQQANDGMRFDYWETASGSTISPVNSKVTKPPARSLGQVVAGLVRRFAETARFRNERNARLSIFAGNGQRRAGSAKHVNTDGSSSRTEPSVARKTANAARHRSGFAPGLR